MNVPDTAWVITTASFAKTFISSIGYESSNQNDKVGAAYIPIEGHCMGAGNREAAGPAFTGTLSNQRIR